MGMKILQGDCLERLHEIDENSVDAIVTDPPYELGFMGKSWDNSGIAYNVSVWTECLRILKPGGHMLAFGGSRTYHRLACAVEDAGFEIRDQIAYFYSSDVDRNEFLNSLTPEQQESFLKAFGRVSSVDWCYGSGFPKSLSVAKATQPKIESRYGKSTCSCMDSRNGQSTGNDGGCRSGQEIRLQRATSITSPQETGDSVLPLDTERCADSLRDLRDSGDSKAQGYAEIEAPLLLKGLCERGTETAGLGSVEIWAGVEEQKGGNSRTGQSVPDVREDASGKRIGTSCTSSETISLQGDESSEKSSSSVRLVPSQDRERNRASSILDPNKREPRRIVSDDHCGWSSAVAHVCSWCGLPSKEWLNAISSLGTALKPAHEPICVARKPLEGTVAANVQKWGTGALNIDGCRVEYLSEADKASATPQGECTGKVGALAGGTQNEAERSIFERPEQLGRWPANVIHDDSEEVLDTFPTAPGQQGDLKETGRARPSSGRFGDMGPPHAHKARRDGEPSANRRYTEEGSTNFAALPDQRRFDAGSAARFFYCAKTSKSERGEGNTHPTVKPLALMRYLCRLATPSSGVILDPFTGSGSTGLAAIQEGFGFIGIELNPEYVTMANNRILKEMLS